MPWYEFAPGTYEIDEFDCDSVFLLVGTERALLLDTGIGLGDLRGLVEEITDKPYDVVITHGHMDHVGGAAWFDKVYLNEKDWDAFPYDGKPQCSSRGRPGFLGTLWVASRVPSALSTSNS